MTDHTNSDVAQRTPRTDGSVFDSCVKMDYQKIFSKIGSGQNSAMCDDREGIIEVTVSLDGDLHIWMKKSPDSTGGNPSFRARTYGGGGQRQRIRDALMLLALAIVEDETQY